MAFRLADGRWLPVRCNRVGCPACGRRHALIGLEMIRDTSARMGNPECAATLTTGGDPDRDLAAWPRHVAAVIEALRRRWPPVQYVAFMEWTTGESRRSGGLRHPHGHLLLRGLPAQAAPAADALLRRVWESRTTYHRTQVGPLRAAEDGVAYLALHHLKPDQAPPAGFRGRRLRPSQGWWGTDPAELRRRASDAVADRAHRHRVGEQRRTEIAELVQTGVPEEQAAELVLGAVDEPIARPARERAELVRLTRLPA